uniref:Ubiquitin-like protein ATG12 n=1 Tax=Ixodes ricinus TaxID=34613 RepID=A0A147BE42_IXORI
MSEADSDLAAATTADNEKTDDTAEENSDNSSHSKPDQHKGPPESFGGHQPNAERKKIDVLLKATGDAPIMQKRKWAVSASMKVMDIADFIRKYLKLEQSESLFIYINQAFAPSLDQEVSNLYEFQKVEKSSAEMGCQSNAARMGTCQGRGTGIEHTLFCSRYCLSRRRNQVLQTLLESQPRKGSSACAARVCSCAMSRHWQRSGSPKKTRCSSHHRRGDSESAVPSRTPQHRQQPNSTATQP